MLPGVVAAGGVSCVSTWVLWVFWGLLWDFVARVPCYRPLALFVAMLMALLLFSLVS